jgi:hypothetical protein
MKALFSSGRGPLTPGLKWRGARAGLLVAIVVLGTAGMAGAQWPCFDSAHVFPCDSIASWQRADRLRKQDLGSVPSSAEAVIGYPQNGIWDGGYSQFLFADPDHAALMPGVPGHLNALAIDSRGTSYVLYAYNYTLLFKYQKAGDSWSLGFALPFQPHVNHAGIVLSRTDDIPHFLYLDGGDAEPSYIVHAALALPSMAWNIDTVAQSTNSNWHGDGRGFAIAVDSLGGVHAAWADPGWNEQLQAVVDQVYYSENTTGEWRTRQVSELGAGVALAVEPKGAAALSYIVRYDNHNYIILNRNRDRGDTVWTADSIDTEPGPYMIDQIQYGPDGQLHALIGGRDCYWCPEPSRLFYTVRTSVTESWGAWQHIFTPSGGGLMQLDCEGQVHILHDWQDVSEIRYDKYYATNAFGSWRNTEFYYGLQPWQILSPAFTLDPYGRGHALVSAHGDPDFWTYGLYYFSSDIVPFTAVNLAEAIDYVYLDKVTPCGLVRYDQNCDHRLDVVDIQWLTNYLFAGGAWGCR